jgi:branched-chain amino acid transport system permease protein
MIASLVGPYWEGVLVNAGINAILGLGFYITFTTGQMSMCHAALMGVGAYTSGLLSIHTPLPFAVVLFLGGIHAGLLGVLISYPCLRLKHFYLAIATLGFGEMLVTIGTIWESIGGALGVQGVPLKTNIYNVYLFLLILIYFFQSLWGSTFWRACKSIKDDDVLAAASGVDIAKYKGITFALGAFICGVGGGLEIHFTTATQPFIYGIWKSTEIFTFTIIGGIEIFIGPIFGAFVLTLLPEVLRAVSNERMIIYAVMLILILIFRPKGLIDNDVWARCLSFFRRITFVRG